MSGSIVTLNLRTGLKRFGGAEPPEPVDIQVYLDGKLIHREASIVFKPDFRHLDLEAGTHLLRVVSKNANAFLEKEIVLSKETWIDVDYDYYDPSHPHANEKGFKIDIRDHPTYHR